MVISQPARVGAGGCGAVVRLGPQNEQGRAPPRKLPRRGRALPVVHRAFGVVPLSRAGFPLTDLGLVPWAGLPLPTRVPGQGATPPWGAPLPESEGHWAVGLLVRASGGSRRLCPPGNRATTAVSSAEPLPSACPPGRDQQREKIHHQRIT